jgi:ATP-dependent helicase HrpB
VGAVLPPHDPLAASEWIVVADIEARAQDARVFVAAALDRADVDELFADQMTTVDESVWDQQAHDVRATRDRRLGAIVVSRQPLDDPSAVPCSTASPEKGCGCCRGSARPTRCDRGWRSAGA